MMYSLSSSWSVAILFSIHTQLLSGSYRLHSRLVGIPTVRIVSLRQCCGCECVQELAMCVWCQVGHCVVAPLYLQVCSLATQAGVCTYGWLLSASACEPCPICILHNGDQSQHGYFCSCSQGDLGWKPIGSMTADYWSMLSAVPFCSLSWICCAMSSWPCEVGLWTWLVKFIVKWGLVLGVGSLKGYVSVWYMRLQCCMRKVLSLKQLSRLLWGCGLRQTEALLENTWETPFNAVKLNKANLLLWSVNSWQMCGVFSVCLVV